MKLINLAVCFFLLCLPPTVSSKFYFCKNGDETIAQDFPCGTIRQPTAKKRYYKNSQSGLRPGELRELKKIEQKKERERNRKYQARKEEQRHYISYKDRLRIKKLRMEKGDIMDDLKRDRFSISEAVVARERIRTIDKEMARIQYPR